MEHFITTEQYQELKKAWKVLSDIKALLAEDILIYNILRGLPANRGFTARTKNIQGNDAWWAFRIAKYEAGRIMQKPDYFKALFGIDMPTELLAKIKEAQHG